MRNNINYQDIQAIVDTYDSQKKLRRIITGDLPHIKAIKVLLERYRNIQYQYNSIFSTPIPTEVKCHKDLLLIAIFGDFIAGLNAILDTHPKGKGSIRTLDEIKELIDNSIQGELVKDWAPIPLFLDKHAAYLEEQSNVRVPIIYIKDDAISFFNDLYKLKHRARDNHGIFAAQSPVINMASVLQAVDYYIHAKHALPIQFEAHHGSRNHFIHLENLNIFDEKHINEFNALLARSLITNKNEIAYAYYNYITLSKVRTNNYGSYFHDFLQKLSQEKLPEIVKAILLNTNDNILNIIHTNDNMSIFMSLSERLNGDKIPGLTQALIAGLIRNFKTGNHLHGNIIHRIQAIIRLHDANLLSDDIIKKLNQKDNSCLDEMINSLSAHKEAFKLLSNENLDFIFNKADQQRMAPLLSSILRLISTPETLAWHIIPTIFNELNTLDTSLPALHSLACHDYMHSVERLAKYQLATTENLKTLRTFTPNSRSIFTVLLRFKLALRQEEFDLLVKHNDALQSINDLTLSRLPHNLINRTLFEHILALAASATDTIRATAAINNHIQLIWDMEQHRLRAAEAEQARLRREAARRNGAREQAIRQPVFNKIQSTHTASVHESVSRSATKLREYYHQLFRGHPIEVIKTISNYQETLRLLKDYINLANEQKLLEVTTALIVIAQLMSDESHGYDFIDPTSQVSTTELLALAILSLNEDPIRKFVRRDETSYIVPRDDAENRLIQCLYEVGRGYNLNDQGKDLGGNSRSVCPPGTFNKIMESLVSTVNLVEITVITKEFALAKLKALVQQAVNAHLASLPRKTDEDKANCLSLLATLINEGPSAIWRDISADVLEAYFSEFSRLYTNSSGWVNRPAIQNDVENAAPYTPIDHILKSFDATLKTPSLAFNGIFAPDQNHQPSPPPEQSEQPNMSC